VSVDEQAQIQLLALSLKELIQPSAMTALGSEKVTATKLTGLGHLGKKP